MSDQRTMKLDHNELSLNKNLKVWGQEALQCREMKICTYCEWK